MQKLCGLFCNFLKNTLLSILFSFVIIVSISVSISVSVSSFFGLGAPSKASIISISLLVIEYVTDVLHRDIF